MVVLIDGSGDCLVASFCDVPPQLSGRMPAEYELVPADNAFTNILTVASSLAIVVLALVLPPPLSTMVRVGLGFGVFTIVVSRDIVVALRTKLGEAGH